MPEKKSVKLPIDAGTCSQQSPARCSNLSASGSVLARPAPSAASSAKTCCRNARRGPAPSAISGFRVGPEAACAAVAAPPANNPAPSAARRSKIISPIATPPRGAASGAVRPGGLNTPNGRFCSGNSVWPFADATQLWRAWLWVSSIIAPSSETIWLAPICRGRYRGRDRQPAARRLPYREDSEDETQRDKAADHDNRAEGVVIGQQADEVRPQRRDDHLREAHQPRCGAGEPGMDAE